MNDDEIDKFEKALRQARPGPVPPSLHDRISKALQEEGPSSRPDNVIETSQVFSWFRPLATAAAVALSALILIFLVRPGDDANKLLEAKNEKENPKPDRVEIIRGWQPVKAGPVIEDARDEGIVFSNENGVPSRRIRYQFTDRYRWENPENGATLEFRIPQESHFVVPIDTD